MSPQVFKKMVGVLRHFHHSSRLFPKAKREINRFFKSIFSRSWHTNQGHTTTGAAEVPPRRPKTLRKASSNVCARGTKGLRIRTCVLLIFFPTEVCFKRIGLLLRLSSKATEKINRVSVSGRPVQGARVVETITGITKESMKFAATSTRAFSNRRTEAARRL